MAEMRVHLHLVVKEAIRQHSKTTTTTTAMTRYCRRETAAFEGSVTLVVRRRRCRRRSPRRGHCLDRMVIKANDTDTTVSIADNSQQRRPCRRHRRVSSDGGAPENPPREDTCRFAPP